MVEIYYRYVVLFVLFFFCLGIKAQKLERYEGTRVINNIEFILSYEYFIEDRDTILHGEYILNEPIHVNDETAYFNFLSVRGNYTNNKVDGCWVVRSGTLRPVGGGVFSDYSYSFKVTGREQMAKGVFKNGRGDGKWQFYEWELSESEIVDTLFYTDLVSATDTSLGCISIRRGAKEHFSAYFDKNGLADGTWAYNSSEQDNPHVRTWKFEDNHLSKKEILKNNRKYTIDYNQEGANKSIKEEMILDSSYFEIVDLIASINDPEPFLKSLESRPTIPFLRQALDRIHQVDSILFMITNIRISGELTAKVIKIPYQESEIAIFDAISDNLKKIDSESNLILTDPQINIAKLSTWEVARYLAVLKHLKTDATQSYRALLDLYSNGSLEYIHRGEKLFKTLSFQTSFEIDSISGDGHKMANYHFHDTNLDLQDVELSTLSSYTQAILTEIKIIKDSLDFFIYELRKEENLVGLESALIKKYEELKHLNDSIITIEFTSIAGFDLNKTLLTFMDKKMGDYSRLESIQEKMRRVEPLIDCFNKLERSIKTLENVPINIGIIDEGYTRTVFNPYTFSNMEEKVKMPIYRSFKELLLPGVFENLQSLTCDEIPSNEENFINLFEGMIELLKRDTRKEERKIRRITDKQKATDILGFNLTFN